MAKDKAQVMLMSLKCGGVGRFYLPWGCMILALISVLDTGLNLTRANRVISLDLGWSEAVEASVNYTKVQYPS